MKWPKELQSLRGRWRSSPYARAERFGLLRPEAMRRVLARERARSDRNSHGFCLLLLEAVAEDSRGQALERAVPRLAEHVRATDVVGWLDERCVALVLPETTTDGAHRLVERLRADIEHEPHPPQCTVLAYPYDDEALERALGESEGEPPDRDGDGRGPGPSAGGGGRAREPRELGTPARDATPVEVEVFLSRPLPAWKRAMDVLLSAGGLIALSPLVAAIAVAIKLDSPGPVVFRQTRAGRGGRPFTFYKFRSMVDGAEARKRELLAKNEQTGPVFKISSDPRITRVGHLLRKSSLDELPQLWNVLKGDMTLVGPRPPTLDEVPLYERWQRRRLEVDGGITGLWQVSGRSTIQWPDYARLDVRYVEQRSFALDLAILFRTIPAVLSGRGAR